MPLLIVQEKMIDLLNPLDSRYRNRTEESRRYFNQESITSTRCEIELWYYQHLLTDERSPFYIEGYDLDDAFWSHLHDRIFTLDEYQYTRIDGLEKETRHDVRAVIEFMVEEITKYTPFEESSVRQAVHFGLTSQDVVDAADVITLEIFLRNLLGMMSNGMFKALSRIEEGHYGTIMLSRTHGQPAVPTSWNNFIEFHRQRLYHFVDEVGAYEPTIKFSGATGGFNAHNKFFEEPKEFLKDFVDNVLGEKFDLTLDWYHYGTQISPYVHRSKLFGAFASLSACLLDFCRDLWNLNARKLLVTRDSNSSSSTMPTKSNPIALENAESNLKIAIMWFQKLQTDLLISRDQRDLSGSSLYRNLGVAFGHFELSIESLTKYLNSTDANKQAMHGEISRNLECFSELVYLQLKLHGVDNARDVTTKMFELGIRKDTTWSREVTGLSTNESKALKQMVLAWDYLPIQY